MEQVGCVGLFVAEARNTKDHLVLEAAVAVLAVVLEAKDLLDMREQAPTAQRRVQLDRAFLDPAVILVDLRVPGGKAPNRAGQRCCA